MNNHASIEAANLAFPTRKTNSNKRYQNIDFANGGDVRGMIRAIDTYMKVANDTTKIVPGHGELATKADLAVFRNMLVTSRDRLQKLYDEGKTEAELVSSRAESISSVTRRSVSAETGLTR